MGTVKENLISINERISEAALAAGRKPSDVKLIAVTKTVTADRISEAVACGVHELGENRVQELCGKYDDIENVNWHLIGHLQTNKVKYIIDKVSLIHSVDSLALASEINRRAEKIGKTQDILIEVNISGEESKFGITADECVPLCESISEMKNVRVKGLMTIAPLAETRENTERIFERLRLLSRNVDERKIDGIEMSELSMGMSGDFELAIAQGATYVRVGRGIFGARS